MTVIIGGGIAALSAAFFLRQQDSDIPITLIESHDAWGGKIKTFRTDHCLVEQGPDGFLNRKTSVVELVEALGLQQQLIARNNCSTPIAMLKQGRFFPIPEGFSGLIPLDIESLKRCGLISSAGLKQFELEMTLLPQVRQPEQTVAHFFCHHFGQEVFDQLVNPLMTGIYGADGHQLSANALFPHLIKFEQQSGSILKALKTSPDCMKSSSFSSFSTGLGRLIEALTDFLKSNQVKLILNTTANKIKKMATRFEIHTNQNQTIVADKVILASGFQSASEILKEYKPQLAHRLSQFNYSSIDVVTLLYPVNSKLSGFDHMGYVVNPQDHHQITAVSFSSKKWAKRCHCDFELIRVFFKNCHHDHFRIAEQHLEQYFGVSRPVSSWFQQWPHSIPLYELGHCSKIAAIDQDLVEVEVEGLYLLGMPIKGVGIGDHISQAKALIRDFF